MKLTLRTVVQTRYEYKNYDYLISPHRNQYHTSSIPSHLSQTPKILDTHPEESDEQLRDMERKKKNIPQIHTVHTDVISSWVFGSRKRLCWFIYLFIFLKKIRECKISIS